MFSYSDITDMRCLEFHCKDKAENLKDLSKQLQQEAEYYQNAGKDSSYWEPILNDAIDLSLDSKQMYRWADTLTNWIDQKIETEQRPIIR